MSWRDIDNQKRHELYQRKTQGEDIAALAEEIGAKVQTLDRALRKFAQEERQPEPASENVSVQERGNHKEIESNSSRIVNLEQLLAHCQVDLNEWAVERHIINKWEVGRKATEKDISWENGVIDGHSRDTGGISVEPLFQVKAWLVRRKPVEITPVLKPVNLNLKFTRQPQRGQGLRSALIIPDMQIGFSKNVMTGELTPFHDRLAMDVVRQIAEVVEPDQIEVIGDINDWSAWSDKYIRMPEFYWTTQPSLIEAAWYLARLRSITRGEMHAIEGNHDIRPETQIVKHLQDAYQLRPGDQINAEPVMGIDNLLGLSRMGIEYIKGYPDAEVWLNDDTRIIHGHKVRGIPGQTAATVVQGIDETTIFGHIHRIEMATRTIRFRGGYRTVTAFSPGCLCHIDGRVPGSSRDMQWQQGAAVVWYDQEHSTIVPITIENGTALYNGQLYQGKEYVDDLVKDTGWRF